METTLAYNIETLLQKKLHIYIELLSLLEAEKDYIVKMDVTSLWKAASRKKEIALEIEKLRNSILFLLDDSKIKHNVDLKTFDLSDLIKSLPVSAKIKADLETIKITIEGKKNEIRQTASSNRKYIQEYLGVIDGVMSTITGASKHQFYFRKGLSVSTITPSFYGSKYGSQVSNNLIKAFA